MSTVNATSQNSAANQVAATLANTSGGTKSLGEQDFLNLLVAQLQNQDPLKPQDPSAFTAQLAQFSSLEQLTNVNSNLTKMASANNMSDLNMIGKQVVVNGDQFNLGSSAVTFGYQLNSAATKVDLEVLDSNGDTVATLEQQNMDGGQHLLSWDGTNDSGKALPAGQYRLAIKATDADGNSVTNTPLVRGVVQGVDLDASGNNLVTDAGTFGVNKVVSVNTP